MVKSIIWILKALREALQANAPDRRWTFYVLLIWAGTLLVAIALLVPETYHPVLLQRKAIEIRKETGDGRWKAPTEQTDRSLFHTIVHSIYRPFSLLLLEPMCSNLCIFSALLLGILYLFFGCFPLVFENNHGFQAWQVGLSFLGKFPHISPFMLDYRLISH